jgi:predicted nucleotidyltransferase
MTVLDSRTEGLVENFASELRECLGERLRSVVLYGSGARGDFLPGKSDLNFMVVVDDLEFEVLQRLTGKVRHFWRKRISTPLVVDEYYLRRSLDVFPLEFSEMKSAYRVVFGDDPLSDLKIDPSDLRLACEAEIKRKLLLLREAFLDAENKKGRMEFLFKQSFKSFMVVLRNLIPLLGENLEGSNLGDVINHAESRLGVKLESLRRLEGMKGRKMKLGKDECKELMAEYMREVRDLARAVDRMQEESSGGMT